MRMVVFFYSDEVNWSHSQFTERATSYTDTHHFHYVFFYKYGMVNQNSSLLVARGLVEKSNETERGSCSALFQIPFVHIYRYVWEWRFDNVHLNWRTKSHRDSMNIIDAFENMCWIQLIYELDIVTKNSFYDVQVICSLFEFIAYVIFTLL